MKRNVVITGMECITSLGNDIEKTWEKIIKAENGIDKIERFNVSQYPCQFGGEIKKFSARRSGLKRSNIMLKYNQYELVAVMQAIKRYKWFEDVNDQRENCAIYLGNQSINLDEELYETIINISEKNMKKIQLPNIGKNLDKFPPLNGIKLLPTLPTHFIAKEYNLHGSANVLYSGDVSSIEAILHAAWDIEAGYYEKAIVASTYNPFTPHEFLWLSNSKLARKTTPMDVSYQLSAPFSNKNEGIIYGEGAGALLIESEESAIQNNRNILAYIYGGTMHTFPEEDFFKLSKCGFRKHMEDTLEICSMKKEDISLLYANAPSYADWDNAEIEAIEEIWNENPIAVTSTKANIGFLGCAAGMIDCILAIKSINQNSFPKLRNAKMDYRQYFSEDRKYIDKCLINTAGIGGNYGSIIIGKKA